MILFRGPHLLLCGPYYTVTIVLYDKANLESIKGDLSNFQTSFLESDPYSRSVEQNWSDLKNAITVTVSKCPTQNYMFPYQLVLDK